MAVRPPRYVPDLEPPADPALRDWLVRELSRISEMLDLPSVPMLHTAPVKPLVGSLAEADGSDWNPGLGAGLYFRDSSGWQKLPYLPISRDELDSGLLNFIEPGHRLSVGSTGVAIPASEVTAATVLRWTPWRHKQTPIFTGTS